MANEEVVTVEVRTDTPVIVHTKDVAVVDPARGASVVTTQKQVSVVAEVEKVFVVAAGVQGPKGALGLPGEAGSKGDKGEKGDPGEPGQQGLDLNYRHVQGVPSAVWFITHNLNKFVSVSIVDSAGSLVEGAIRHVDTDHIEITFTGAFAGEAYCN